MDSEDFVFFPDETIRFLGGEWSERNLVSGVQSKPRTTASSGAIRADTCIFSDTSVEVNLHF